MSNLAKIDKDLKDIQLEAPALWATVKNTIKESTKGGVLTDVETLLYLKRCKDLNANPLSQDIYAVRYGGKLSFLASIQVLRKIARGHPGYRGVDISVEKDEEGNVLSATAVAKHRHGPDDIEKQSFTAIFKEFTSGQNKWRVMQEHMIKKTAESHALRMLYPTAFEGLYEADEIHKFKHEAARESDESRAVTEVLLEIDNDVVPEFNDLKEKEL
jgi:hypothetical protein